MQRVLCLATALVLWVTTQAWAGPLYDVVIAWEARTESYQDLGQRIGEALIYGEESGTESGTGEWVDANEFTFDATRPPCDELSDLRCGISGALLRAGEERLDTFLTPLTAFFSSLDYPGVEGIYAEGLTLSLHVPGEPDDATFSHVEYSDSGTFPRRLSFQFAGHDVCDPSHVVCSAAEWDIAGTVSATRVEVPEPALSLLFGAGLAMVMLVASRSRFRWD